MVIVRHEGLFMRPEQVVAELVKLGLPRNNGQFQLVSQNVQGFSKCVDEMKENICFIVDADMRYFSKARGFY